MKSLSRIWIDNEQRQWRITTRPTKQGRRRLEFVEQGAWPPRVRSVWMPDGKELETLSQEDLEKFKPIARVGGEGTA